MNQEEKDKLLWKLAKKRVSFKRHLMTYIAMNIFFWCVWLFFEEEKSGTPWPVFASFGWGIGIFFHFWGAYGYRSEINSVEKEFEKLKSKE